jgi:hypothetical protein
MPQIEVAAEDAVVNWTGASTQILLLATEQPGGPPPLFTQEANTGGVDGYWASVGSSLDAVIAALVAVTALISNVASKF